MTVGDLIKRLQQYNPNTEVMVYNGEMPEYCRLSGVIKITCKATEWQPEIFEDAEFESKNAFEAILVD